MGTNKQDSGSLSSQQAGVHWTGRPLPMLFAVLAAKLALYLLSSGVALTALIPSVQGNPGFPIILSITAVEITLPLIAGGLFYRFVRNKQKSAGIAGGPSWAVAPAFWIGCALALAFFTLNYWRFFAAASSTWRYAPDLLPSAAINILGSLLQSLANALITALFLALLYPVLRRRFGVLGGALFIAGAYAGLACVIKMFSSLLLPVLQAWLRPDLPAMALSGWSWMSLLSSVVSAFSGAMLSVALYLLASGRIPGAWMLITAVPGLSALLNRAIDKALSESGAVSARSIGLAVDVPYDLVVLALSLAVVAGFARWKTLEEFGESLRGLGRKLRKIQDTE